MRDTENNDKTATVVGAGLIGRGWSIVFASAGWNVRLFDTDADALAAAPTAIETQARMMLEHGLLNSTAQVTDRIQIEPDLAAAVAGTRYVQECGPELEEVKQELFADLDRLAPADAILASSTSAIVASRFTGNLKGRERMLVAHPVNPPHLVPLVEIAPAEWTAPDTVEKAIQVMEEVGQTPILVKQEVDGFILNRLQAALLNEAVRLVDGGYVSPEDLDKTVRDGLGLRWSFMGPFETIDLNAPAGTRDYAARYSDFFRRIVPSQSTVPDWQGAAIDSIEGFNREQRDVTEIAERSEWRDNRLAALRAHKRDVQDKT
ncbi:MAG: 3-hydroxyacyl-CoA dehydrogenase [Gammaproteobacteria bacterium]|nr:3-hydroxyacyl-CoA dehydrogenase [Gammaproteobacteria bacterium]